MGNSYVTKLLKYKQEVVEEIRNAVKARCGSDQWLEVARGIQDKMRVLQRDKLLDYVTSWPITVYSRELVGHGEWVIVPHHIELNTPEDVYDYLLIVLQKSFVLRVFIIDLTIMTSK